MWYPLHNAFSASLALYIKIVRGGTRHLHDYHPWGVQYNLPF